MLGLFDGSRRQRVEEFWALRSVSLKVNDGEALGLVGRNGSGKSTFLKVDRRDPSADERRPARRPWDQNRQHDRARDRVSSRADRAGERFSQRVDSGLSRDDARAVYDSVVSYSGLRHFMDVPLKNYSSGMTMRLGFAIAATMDPDVLLLDEIFAVGDADFQRQCMATLQSFQTRGKTIIFVSHSSAAVQAVCRRVAVLDHGRLLYDGGVDDGLTEYRRLTALVAARSARARSLATALVATRPPAPGRARR